MDRITLSILHDFLKLHDFPAEVIVCPNDFAEIVSIDSVINHENYCWALGMKWIRGGGKRLDWSHKTIVEGAHGNTNRSD